MRRSIPRTALLVFSAFFACSAFGEEMKIGVFDFGRITQETNEGQRIQKKLKDFQDHKQAELAAKEKELKDLQDQLAAQALALSPEKRSEMEKDVQKKQNDLQILREGAQREWQIEFNEAQDGFLQKVRDVVEALGREDKFTLILERDYTVYRNDSVEITPRVIERFNKMYPEAPSPASASKGGAPKGSASKPPAPDKPPAPPKEDKPPKPPPKEEKPQPPRTP